MTSSPYGRLPDTQPSSHDQLPSPSIRARRRRRGVSALRLHGTHPQPAGTARRTCPATRHRSAGSRRNRGVPRFDRHRRTCPGRRPAADAGRRQRLLLLPKGVDDGTAPSGNEAGLRAHRGALPATGPNRHGAGTMAPCGVHARPGGVRGPQPHGNRLHARATGVVGECRTPDPATRPNRVARTDPRHCVGARGVRSARAIRQRAGVHPRAERCGWPLGLPAAQPVARRETAYGAASRSACRRR